MLTPVREMLEPERRRHQQSLGLVVVTRRSDPPPTEKRKRMDETVRPQNPRAGSSRAQQALEHLMETPTFKDVAIHEIQRAAVYMPLLITAGFGLLWANKRFFLKAI